MTSPDALASSYTWIDGDSVFDLIRLRAEATPDKTMLIDDSERHVLFGEYHEAVLEMALVLSAEGIQRGSRVAWQLPNSVDSIVLAGALSRLGCVQVPLIMAYRRHDLEHILDEVHADFFVVDAVPGSDRFDLAIELATPRLGLRVLPFATITDAAHTGGAQRAQTHALPDPPRPTADEVTWIIYTSGTTGAAKGVQHSDATVMAGSRASFIPMEVTADDRLALNFPFAHIGGVMLLCTMTSTGASAVVVPHFTPPSHVPLFRRLGVTLPGAGPAFFRLYLQEQRNQPGDPIIPSARFFMGGGAPKSRNMYWEMKNELGTGMLSAYGMSECPMIVANYASSPESVKAASEGRAVPDTTVRIVDREGRDVAVGDEGEVIVRGPQLFLGYLNNPNGALGVDEEGFFHTGDLGRLDEDGYLYLTGRLKDLIIRKGENISALEVEKLLAEHPNVAEVSVIGIPDDERGEMCCAVIVSRDQDISIAEASTFLLDSGLPLFKVPERLEFIDVLPKNSLNKVVKSVLRERFAESTADRMA